MTVELSVVVPAHNAARWISEALDSVLAQEDAPAFEVVVVDDGSTDGTAGLVESRYPQVRLIRKPNGGPASARNLGVRAAGGEVVVFTDADDVMLPGRLASQGGFMIANPEVGLSFGNLQRQRAPERDALAEFGLGFGDGYGILEAPHRRLVVDGNFISNGASAVRRDIYLECGGQREDVSVAEEYALNCAVARRHAIAGTNRFLTWYRQGHGGNLMASAETYVGPLEVLADELAAEGHRLSPEDRARARARGRQLLRMYLRWLWIERGRVAALAELEVFDGLATPGFSAFWRAVTLVPPGFGRVLRAARRQARPAPAGRELAA